MKLYMIERSYDAFIVYPVGCPEEAVLCEGMEALWGYVSQTDDDDGFLMTDEAVELLECL